MSKYRRFDKIYSDFHAPITNAPSDFEAGTDPETIKGHWCEDNSPYFFKVPYQLRERFISLLNTIRKESPRNQW